MFYFYKIFWGGLPALYAFSSYTSWRSYPAMLILHGKTTGHHWPVPPDPPVLGWPPAILVVVDRDRTVSQRSKPSSRTTLIGEQPNPWNRLQLQDVMSRHRGAKQPRRFGLLGVISLLSLAYLLSVDRRPFRTAPSGHYDQLAFLIDLYIFQSGELIPLRSHPENRVELTIAHPRYSLGGGHPSQTTSLTKNPRHAKGRYLTSV
mmetsp:Transcript_38080/g.61145  ORF Transcript_38080/g.61145 Transcript_38080/m.61145 type:complete len:204 (-) Transcript_38080:1713-2324(-)